MQLAGVDNGKERGQDEDHDQPRAIGDGQLHAQALGIVSAPLIPACSVSPETADGHEPQGAKEVDGQVKVGHVAPKKGYDGDDNAHGRQTLQRQAAAIDLPGGKDGGGPHQVGSEQVGQDLILGLGIACHHPTPPPEARAQGADPLPGEGQCRGEGQRPAEFTPEPILEPAVGIAQLAPQQGQRRQDAAHGERDQEQARQAPQDSRMPGREAAAGQPETG